MAQTKPFKSISGCYGMSPHLNPPSKCYSENFGKLLNLNLAKHLNCKASMLKLFEVVLWGLISSKRETIEDKIKGHRNVSINSHQCLTLCGYKQSHFTNVYKPYNVGTFLTFLFVISGHPLLTIIRYALFLAFDDENIYRFVFLLLFCHCSNFASAGE